MRKWFGRLHGAQLLMLLVPFYVVGVGMIWATYTILWPSAQHAYELVYKDLSISVADHNALLAEANAQNNLVLRGYGIGLGICLLTAPMIWWWLSARRRKDLPGI